MATNGVSFPLENESIDAAFSYITFQHMPTKEVIRKNIEEIGRVLKPGGIAKLQLRGIPVRKEAWFYGPSLTPPELESLIIETKLTLVQSEGEGSKYFWVWLKKFA